MVSGTEVCDAWRTTHEPSRCSALLRGREVLDVLDLAVADHHVGVAGDDRRDELGDVGPVVLVVGVGVDDHVGAELQRRVQARLEARRQALVVGQADDVVDAVLARDLDRAVGRAVVDDQPLDDVEARQLARQVAQRDGEGLLLVQAGDLDDELHGDALTVRYRARGVPSPRWRAPPSPAVPRSRVLARGRVADPRSSPGWRSACSASAPRSGSSSTRRIRTTTPTTRCCGAARCSTSRRRTSRASGSRPSTRWRSSPARC